ncbi:uncharacterized protein LOC116424546 isoform X1 [Nomia melanderi]|uniref:uncharacterized protein LOC116424546 isoform X1 n=2 Tax=Nomia melanderi TaxID=2448451 RepID=UPI003FCD4FF0
MSDSIKVAIKVRPLIKREKDENQTIQWVVQGNSIVSTDTEIKKRGDGGFCFDHIFDMNASNSDVFDTIVKPIVDAAVNGFNGTVFAYGQTSSGKTYTMMGTLEEPGIIPLAIEHMFDAITNTNGREFLLRISYLEIYKEKVNDLLNRGGIDLKLKEDNTGQIILQCKEEITNSPENMMSIMKKGDKNRRTGTTNMNERSSRSHTIFRITIESREAGGDSDGAIQVSQLNLVDLAGSERARQTGATGERFKEGLHINLSLSTLGLVIMQLSELQDGQKYVNFRDSKLTRLLQNSLGGNAMTAIICAVTPAALDETQCTLSFASRAKSVKNKPQVNEVMSDAALLKRYAKQLSKLQAELHKIKTENRVAEVEEMESKLQEKERINQLLEERIELLKTRIVSGDAPSDDSFKSKSKRRQTWGGPGMFNKQLPVFQPAPGLPVIKETSSVKSHRKSIIQSVDLMNQTFQTAFTDFELELFESERDRVNGDSDSEDEPYITKRRHRVTFKDDVCSIKSNNSITPEKINTTPPRSNTATQTMSYQASPSTPKHVLRRCITDLTKEFVELREFTTLEKQLLCEQIHCHADEDERIKKLEEMEQEKPASECYMVEYTPEVRERLKILNLAEENNVKRIISALCGKLKEIEEQNILEKDANQKVGKQFSELKKQIQNITSERDEFEYMSRELRTELKKKTTELELKNMSEESIREEEIKKILELEKKLKSVMSEKKGVEELNADSTKRITELQKEVDNIISERKEFEHIRRELYTELNKKSLEVEELQKQTKEITAEKAKLEQTTVDLRVELNQMISDKESKVILEQVTQKQTTEEACELQKQIENLTLEKTELERVNADLKIQLESSLESKSIAEQIAAQESVKKNLELEEQVRNLITEKQELKNCNVELNKKIAEFESAIKLKETMHEEAIQKVSVLQREIENLATEKNELKQVVQLEQIECQKEMMIEKISELTKQVEDIQNQKNELERVNTDLRAELDQKTSEFEARITLEQVEHQKGLQKVSDLENQVKDMIVTKTELEETVSLQQIENQKATKKISELEKQIECITIEKSECERTNIELHAELNQISSELETKASELTEYKKSMEKIAELEDDIKRITSEKNQLLHHNSELQAELVQKSSEINAKTTTEHIQIEQMQEKVSELEKQIDKSVTEKSELERIIAELRSELTATVTLKQTETQNAIEQIAELKKQMESMVSEKVAIENELRMELDKRTSEVEAKAEQAEIMKAKETILELENKVESFMLKQNELHCIITELNEKNSKLESLVNTDQASKQNSAERICELEKQINELNKKATVFETKNNGDCINEDGSLGNSIKDLHHTTNTEIANQSLKDLQNTTNTEIANQSLKDQLDNQSSTSWYRFNDSTADVSALMLTMEADKSQLEENLYLKTQELEEIKYDVQSLKQDIETLQKTIYLLTNENMEMATKLTTEQENAARAELNLQRTIDELYTRISEVTNEKITLESNLAALNDQLELLRSKSVEVSNEEELFASYRDKIDKLTAENIELSSSVADKEKELESIKESKSLLYDHECMFKEKIAVLMERNECLQSENDELSTDLIDKIEENDSLKEQCEMLKKMTEQSLATNESSPGDSAEDLRSENNMLRAEILELKSKVTTLSEENTKFSNDLLQTMEDLDNSRNEKSLHETSRSSIVLNDGTEIADNDTQDIVHEGNQEAVASKITMLQEKIDHLTRLNKKLSDLKLTSCSQCAHLKNLNDSRRALKFEAKALNQKLEDLQRKFDRKCEDIEVLKNKANQELNLSGRDMSVSVSFVDDMNVSFIEERIQNLNDELQTLKADHDKLTVMYEDKCTELGQLQSNMILDVSGINSSPKNRSDKKGYRLEQVQNCIDRLKSDIDDLKKNSTNFTAMLNQFRVEKTSLLEKVNSLKMTNEELEQKISANENIAAEKVQVLENELANMSKEIEDFSKREKVFENQRLTLEVELEGLRVEQENKNVLINQLNERVSSLRSDLDLVTGQKQELLALNSMASNYKEESDALKKQCEELENERAHSKELVQELEARVENLQTKLTQQECLCEELQGKGCHMEELFQKSEEEKSVLLQKLQATEAELNELTNNLETRHKSELYSMSTQYEHRIKESEDNLQKLNDTLNKYVDENLNLKQEVTRLRNMEEKYNEVMNGNERVSCKEQDLTRDVEKLYKELDDIKLCITQELKSLKCSIKPTDLYSKSVNEIFIILLQTLVSKEQEMIKTLRETFEREKQVLEDEIEQCVDTEKRATTWARELEAEIEKLQVELTERERCQKEYENRISELNHLFRESTHDNETLKKNMKTLEMDLHNLQTELDTRCKIDSKQEGVIFVAQKREKEAQEIFKNKELEFQSKLTSEREMYEKRINDLVHNVETFKTKNIEMNSVIEGLDANEKQLKNIIEANAAEIKKNNQYIERMNAEFEQLTDAYNEMSQQVDKKTAHIEEIAMILKNKCDMVSEYKTKLETIMPEYEMLKEHINDKKAVIERYKEEIETLKKDREEQLDIIKDKLKSEEIKNTGLTKQLNELNNKNVALIDELNELKESYELLQQDNAKLDRKLRNSTSKIKAEAEIEELKEANKRLQGNLEGACNRVAELQEIKNQTLTELTDAKAMYNLLLQENTEMKKTLSTYETKYNASSSLIHESKLDELLLEKNTVALELEYKKLMLTQKEKEIKEYSSQVQQLQEKNKELDDELEEYASIIQERNIEISELEGKLHSRLTENARISELEEKLKNLTEENEKFRDQIDALKMRLQMDTEQTEDTKFRQNENVIRILKKENFDLQSKLNAFRKQTEMKQNNADTSGINEVSMNQSRDFSKKVPNNLEGAWNRVTELQGEKYEIMKELADSRRQCDNLSKENLEVKKVLQVYKCKLNEPNLSREGEKLDDVLQELLLSQKDKELKECVNKIRDLATKNKDLDIELGKYAATVHERDVEISKLKETLKLLREENNKFKSEIAELQIQSRSNVQNESVKRQLQSETSDKHISEYEDKCQQLNKKIHELELQLVSKNGKIATLEIQIQSESFPYQRKCKELEEHLLGFRNKNKQLNLEIMKLQRTVNDVNAWECDICRRWRVNRKDQGCQTIPSNFVRFCGSNSGVVEDNVRIQKLEKQNALLKDLCRSRARRIKELETEINRFKELERTQESVAR